MLEFLGICWTTRLKTLECVGVLQNHQAGNAGICRVFVDHLSEMLDLQGSFVGSHPRAHFMVTLSFLHTVGAAIITELIRFAARVCIKIHAKFGGGQTCTFFTIPFANLRGNVVRTFLGSLISTGP